MMLYEKKNPYNKCNDDTTTNIYIVWLDSESLLVKKKTKTECMQEKINIYFRSIYVVQ